MRMRTIEHVDFEGPAAIARHAAEHGHALARTRIFAGDPFPAVEDFDLLVVMGGPMSVHDELQFPWLAAEKRLIRQASDVGRGVLGICLGAQLLAEVLGGRVSKNPEREIGWHAVRRTPEGQDSPAFAGFPEAFDAFHWHGETFSVPACATRLASSEACANQAFAVGAKLVGLQFHLETTAESMELLIANCADEIAAGSHVQPPARMRQGVAQLAALTGLLDLLLTNMTKEM